jgi:hypothetical protein
VIYYPWRFRCFGFSWVGTSCDPSSLGFYGLWGYKICVGGRIRCLAALTYTVLRFSGDLRPYVSYQLTFTNFPSPFPSFPLFFLSQYSQSRVTSGNSEIAICGFATYLPVGFVFFFAFFCFLPWSCTVSFAFFSLPRTSFPFPFPISVCSCTAVACLCVFAGIFGGYVYFPSREIE